MAKLREEVKIITLSGEVHGHLFVGQDWLPELEINYPDSLLNDYERQNAATWAGRTETFTPASFPAAWSLRTVDSFEGPLYEAWLMIDSLRENIRDAEREACETEADAKERERTRAIDNRIQEELDHE